jgi:hypothetical protein
MISMFTLTARWLHSTLDNMATPCSVKAYGAIRRPPRPAGFEITDCDFKSANSSAVSWNMKSPGNRSMLRFTACTSSRVSTPYMAASSASSMTFCPRRTRIACSMRSAGTRIF